MAESTKFNKAVARANGETTDASEQTPNVTGGMLIRKGVKVDEMRELVTSGDWEFAPQNMSLEEGDQIEGILEGNGPDAEFEDKNPVTGEITTRTVMTWIVASADGSQRAGILSSAQLDRKLPPFVGGQIKILRNKDIKIANGFKVADYLVAGRKLADGKKRAWATKPVIEAASTDHAPQLAAGAAPATDAHAPAGANSSAS